MSHVWPIWLPLRAGIQYWHSSPCTNRGPEEKSDSKNTWNSIQTMILVVQRKRAQGGYSRFQDEGLACDTTKARSPLPCASRGTMLHLSWDQFLVHHTNLNGVILTCTNGRWKHNSSKFYVFLCCINANKEQILFSQTLLGHVTLLTPDQQLRRSDCSAWEGTSRYPHQLLGYQERGIKI